MRNRFVVTSNVARFHDAVEAAERRGAPEASWVCVVGDPGHGKTRAALRWSDEHDAIHLRLKPEVTATWLLRDVARELGLSDAEIDRAQGREKIFHKCFERLAERPRPIVIDEAEHAVSGGAHALESVRALSDLTEILVVLVGRAEVPRRLQRHPQLWSRVASVAKFEPLPLVDVTLLRTKRCEVEVDEAVDQILLDQSGGLARQVMNGIANIERLGLSLGRCVGPDDLAGITIVRDVGKVTEQAAELQRGKKR